MNQILDTVITNGVFTPVTMLAASAVSLILGLLIAFTYLRGKSTSKSFAITLTLIPVIVQMVIMMVNGNIGAGVAVAGAFSLVRFRSAPGSGKEITNVFLAMAVGLATGMGYLTLAILFTLVVLAVYYGLDHSSFAERSVREKILKITVPESLDFEGIFDDIFTKYTEGAELLDVRTSGMGSLYKLDYRIYLRDKASQKAMMDEIRVRNGNLEITCSRPIQSKTEEL